MLFRSSRRAISVRRVRVRGAQLLLALSRVSVVADFRVLRARQTALKIRYDLGMPTHQPVKTCVFPVAGRGTRFLPVTKASPKEMLPIVDKPLIQYAVDEALSAGADTLVFITGSSKRAIEDHFDSNPELESVLQQQGKQELLDALNSILPSWASCVYIRQSAPLGLGHAVLCARPVVGNAPFMVHLADDLIDAKTPCLKQMADIYAKHQVSVLGVQNVPKQDTDKYGIVTLEKTIEPRVGKMPFRASSSSCLPCCCKTLSSSG